MNGEQGIDERLLELLAEDPIIIHPKALLPYLEGAVQVLHTSTW